MKKKTTIKNIPLAIFSLCVSLWFVYQTIEAPHIAVRAFYSIGAAAFVVYAPDIVIKSEDEK